MVSKKSTIELADKVMCPNCWHKFPPEDSLYIANSVNLAGDPRLTNPRELRRFLPTRFTADGAAIDEEGELCRDLACPRCHLFIPRVMLEKRPPLLLSILGKSGSGKSVFLASMMNQLRNALPSIFKLGMTEPHAPSNGLVHHYENILFGNPNPEAHVRIPKTPEVQADTLPPDDPFRVFRRVKFGDQERDYPRPMFFQATPLKGHPFADRAHEKTQTLCLYDVAGEFFESHSKNNEQITEYMAHSAGLFFVFDPVQEPKFLRQLHGKSKDPQIDYFTSETFSSGENRAMLTPQHTVLAAANASVKKMLGQEVSRPLDVPLIIIAAKYDAWDCMLDGKLPGFARKASGKQDDPLGQVASLKTSLLQEKSDQLRNLFLQYAPQLVATADQFSRNVYYVPVTSTGAPPIDCREECAAGPAPEPGGKPKFCFRTKDVKPAWAAAPLLWMMARHFQGLVPFDVAKSSNDQTSAGS